MIIIKYKNNLIKYILSITILMIFLLLIKKLNIENNDKEELYTKSIIEYKNQNTDIYVEYPRFNNENIDSIITNIIYNDVNEFKSNNNKKTLNISYNVYNIDDYVNISFNISNSSHYYNLLFFSNCTMLCR